MAVATRSASSQSFGRRLFGGALAPSCFLVVTGVLNIGLGALPAGATTSLSVTPNNPTTSLTDAVEPFPGEHVCQGQTYDAPFGYVSGGVAPYTVTMTLDAGLFYAGSAGLHSYVVKPDGHIKIISPFTLGAVVHLANGTSETDPVTVTETDATGAQQQIGDTWTLTADC